jgi:hypothetical protein
MEVSKGSTFRILDAFLIIQEQGETQTPSNSHSTIAKHCTNNNYITPNMNKNAFNAKRKIRGAVYAIMAINELRRRLASRARHATMFTSDTMKQQAKQEHLKACRARHATVFSTKDFDPARKFRAAVYVIIASNEIKHWIDSEETLLHDPTLKHHENIHIKPQRVVGEKFNPRRTFKAAVYAVMFVNDLQYWWLDLDPNKMHLLPSKVRDQVELRAHVKEMLGWLGQHTTRPSFVHEFYQDHDVIHESAGSKLRSAFYTIRVVNKLNRHLRRKQLESQVKHRFDWLSEHVPDKHPHHNVHFDPHNEEETMSVVHHDKNFEAKRKALGDTVYVRRAGMLPEHEEHRSHSFSAE